jgi:hypothetical protein
MRNSVFRRKMLPIVFGSQWDSELARGLAFALGRGYCAVAELEKRKNKTLNIGPLFHLQPSYHASVLRGLVAGGKKLEAAPIMVVQMTAQSEQKARAMSAHGPSKARARTDQSPSKARSRPNQGPIKARAKPEHGPRARREQGAYAPRKA